MDPAVAPTRPVDNGDSAHNGGHSDNGGSAPVAATLPVWRHRFRVAGGPDAPRAVRRSLAGLEPYLGVHGLWKACQVVTEVVANSVVHGGATDLVDVEAVVSGRALRVQITDHLPTFTPPAEPAPDHDGGHYGLFLVDQLTDRWGVTAVPGGVWFEIDHGEHAGHG